ncbi:unnamed protein product [Ilex paraguariensis]|uniref:Uncharacterized protein n=1 Tax=Ilex paraguariensis TaxID=185542 RepID=A0ABC8U2V4_9AQUA
MISHNAPVGGVHVYHYPSRLFPKAFAEVPNKEDPHNFNTSATNLHVSLSQMLIRTNDSSYHRTPSESQSSTSLLKQTKPSKLCSRLRLTIILVCLVAQFSLEESHTTRSLGENLSS